MFDDWQTWPAFLAIHLQMRVALRMQGTRRHAYWYVFIWWRIGACTLTENGQIEVLR
jgi:hypothetical protein